MLMIQKRGQRHASTLTTTLVTFIVAWTTAILTSDGARTSCKLSEFPCDQGQCISLDKFCNGVADCADKSDEPKFCTPCNRTYYGQVGRTYELEIRRPREDRLPLLCFLNFTAAGGDLGDLVQLTFDSFTVGRFVSFTMDGCPDGYMTIREEGRPDTGGQWCGSAWGYTVYYSETRSLNLSLNLYTLSDQGISSGYNFDFKVSFKFLKFNDAHLRYGNNSSQLSYRGELVQGSYCTRQLSNCDKRPCRVQSPNFPGVYPRNVTCYYRLEHSKVPAGKQALIAVRQRNSHKIHIKDQMVKYERSQRILRVWDQCDVVQDYLTVYDGGSTIDPVLVRFCGGDVVPDIISSGPDMLLEFHTSPYDNPFHPVPLSFLPGFELDVQIIYVDSRSHSYVRRAKIEGKQPTKSSCDFFLTAFESSWGLLENPRHSLPPNTTCFYQFQGKKDETVWLSFIKYHAASVDPSSYQLDSECNARLRIWDGRIGSNTVLQSNATLIHEFCKDDAPKLCDHYFLSNMTRMTRPCSLSESFISKGQDMTLELFLKQGSVLFPMNFLLRYEFVNTKLEGSHYNESANQCDRVFRSERSSFGSFRSPKSVFYYGRGGRKNVSCVFRFETRWDEQVKIKLTRAKFGNRLCTTVFDSRISGKHVCSHEFLGFDFENRFLASSGATSQSNSSDGNTAATSISELWINEYPWSAEEFKIPRHCICSELDSVLSFTSLISSTIELNFTISNMNITEDYNDYYFEGEYNFIQISDTDSVKKCESMKKDRRLSGTSGEITLPKKPDTLRLLPDPEKKTETVVNARVPEHLLCNNYPYLIQSTDSYLYLRVRGYELGFQSILHNWQDKLYQNQCPTKNRIVVYSVADSRDLKVVCPQDATRLNSNFEEDVQIFSKGWHDSFSQDYTILKPQERNFVVEFIGDQDNESLDIYSILWMQVSKRPDLIPTASSRLSSDHEHTVLDCPYRCPELNACISWTLWCDGKSHCPEGSDEEESSCSFQFGVSFLYILIGGTSLFILTFLLLLTVCLRSRGGSSSKEKHQSDRGQFQNNHLNHSNHQNGDTFGNAKHLLSLQTTLPSSEDLFIDVKDVC